MNCFGRTTSPWLTTNEFVICSQVH
jgi:hypothetical protein